MPIRDRQLERRTATRLEILDAAWQAAREDGLSQITLRDIAQRVGMRAPSLYSHFASKNAIYDAMFAQAWADCCQAMRVSYGRTFTSGRAALKHHARTYFDFAVADLARNQLMNSRIIVDFEPTPESYAPAVATLEELQRSFAPYGITQEDIDLYVALVGGLVDSQLANDPGGSRWSRLLDRAIDMLADNLGLEPEKEHTS